MSDSTLAVKISEYPKELVTNTQYTFKFKSPLVADYWVSFLARFKGDDETIHTVNIIPTSQKRKNATSCTWTPSRDLFTDYIKNASSVQITFELKSYYPTSGITWTTVTVTSTLKADSWFNPYIYPLTIQGAITKGITIGGVQKGIGGVSGIDAGSNILLRGNAKLKYYSWRLKDSSQSKTLKFVSKSVSTESSSISTSITEVGSGTLDTIVLSVRDSRGFTKETEKTLETPFEFINYLKPSIYDEDVQRGTYDSVNDTFTVDDDGLNVRVFGRLSIDGNALPTTITVVAKATGGGSTQTFTGISQSASGDKTVDSNWTVLKSGNVAAEFPKTTGWELTFKAIDSITANYGTQQDIYGVQPSEKVLLLRSLTFLINGTDGATGIAFGEAAEQGFFKITGDWRIKKKGVEEADFITENTTDSNGWTVIKTRLGLKIGIKSFEFTDVAFNLASGNIYKAIKFLDLPSGFVPSKIYATSDNSTRWVISSSFSSLTSRIAITFGSGLPTQESSLKGDILIIGFEIQGE